MISLKDLSLEKKLGVTFLGVIGVSLFITFLGFTASVLFYSTRSFRDEVISLARVAGATSRAPLVFHDAQSGGRVLSGLQTQKHIVYAGLVDREGVLLTEFGRKPAGIPSSTRELFSEWSLARFVVVLPVELEGELVGNITIVAALDQLYLQFKLFILIGLAVTLFAALGAAHFGESLRRWVTEPLLRVRNFAQEISINKDFDIRMDESSVDAEVHELVRAFNHMLGQIKERDNALTLAKERAEQADRTKSAFLATVSHELRTPMHAILGMTDEVMQTEISSEQRELLQIVKSSGTLLVSIINDILDFSKIEAGKVVLTPSLTDIDELVERVLQMFELQARKKAIILDSVIEMNVPRKIIVDGGRVAQVLVNLVGNALKFTHSGSITIAVALREAHGDLASLQFTVADTGIGIPEEAIDSVFESFTQVKRLGGSNEGTGLGLAISAKLVNLMGGWIWVDSKPGVGSQFHFVIEANAVERQGWTPDSGNEKNRVEKLPDNGFIILVVEDNLVNSKLASRILERAGYRVKTAFNGQEALDVLDKERIDLVLMDITMPVMDGLEATRRIRARERDHHTKIVALTANAYEDQASVCFEVGIDEFLTKPLDARTLIDTITRVLSKGHSRSRLRTPRGENFNH